MSILFSFLSTLRTRILQSPVFNFNQVLRDRWVAKRAAEVPPNSKVLDVGAGACPYRLLFAHCVYSSQDFCGLPKDGEEGGGYGAIDFRSDASDIPVPDASFDVVLCTELIEHVPDPVAVLHELGRILRPGGTLLLTAPLGSGLHQEPYHFYGGYTPFWYERFLPEAGFGELSIEANGGFYRHYGQESFRWATMLAPWKRELSAMARVLLFPFWLVSLPWFAIIVPVICSWLDPLDKSKQFTTGYHVRAVKTGQANRSATP